LRIAAALALTAGLLGGCNKNETVVRVGRLADEACACRTAACADAVDKKYYDLKAEGVKRGSRSDREEIEKEYGRMRACIAKARAAQTTTTTTGGNR
jgi:hypothetical protein